MANALVLQSSKHAAMARDLMTAMAMAVSGQTGGRKLGDVASPARNTNKYYKFVQYKCTAYRFLN